MLSIGKILSGYNPVTGEIPGRPAVKRRLSDLAGCFADAPAYEMALVAGNPMLYSVAAFEPAGGDGDLHYGESACSCRGKSATSIS
jgi:glucose-6-phosphate isomerase